MKAARWRVWRAGVGALVVVGVVALIGPGAVLAGVGALDLGTTLLAVALAVPATIACAWRWRLVAHRLGAGLELRPAIAGCYAAQFLNTTLPGGVAGDLHRGLVHGRAGGDVVRGLRAVAWERLGGQVVLAGVAAVVLLVSRTSVSRDAVPLWAAGLAACLVVLLASGRLPAGRQWWTRLVSTLAHDLRALSAIGVWPGVVLASLVAIGCHLATYLLVARAVGVTAPLTTLVPLVLLVFVAAALPLNVAGWGPREGMAAWSFAAAGLGADQGLATGVAYGLVVLVASLPGALALVVADAGTRRVMSEGSRVGA